CRWCSVNMETSRSLRRGVKATLRSVEATALERVGTLPQRVESHAAHSSPGASQKIFTLNACPGHLVTERLRQSRPMRKSLTTALTGGFSGIARRAGRRPGSVARAESLPNACVRECAGYLAALTKAQGGPKRARLVAAIGTLVLAHTEPEPD